MNWSGRYESIPFVKKETFDLDSYVVTKALDGLFHVLGDGENVRFERIPKRELLIFLKRYSESKKQVLSFHDLRKVWFQ